MVVRLFAVLMLACFARCSLHKMLSCCQRHGMPFIIHAMHSNTLLVQAQDSNADEPSCSMPHSQLILQESALTAESLHHQQLTDEMPVSANCPSLLAAEAPAAFVEGLERVLAVLDSENGLAQVQTKTNETRVNAIRMNDSDKTLRSTRR